jgi:hypothetical protein
MIEECAVSRELPAGRFRARTAELVEIKQGSSNEARGGVVGGGVRLRERADVGFVYESTHAPARLWATSVWGGSVAGEDVSCGWDWRGGVLAIVEARGTTPAKWP